MVVMVGAGVAITVQVGTGCSTITLSFNYLFRWRAWYSPCACAGSRLRQSMGTLSSSRDGQGRDSWSLQQQVVVMCLPRLCWLYSTLYYNELPLQSTAAGRLSQYHIIYNGKHKKSVREFLPDTILTTIAQLVQLFERCLVQVVRRNNHYSPSPGHHIQNDMFVECNFIHILTGCFHQM